MKHDIQFRLLVGFVSTEIFIQAYSNRSTKIMIKYSLNRSAFSLVRIKRIKYSICTETVGEYIYVLTKLV